MELPVRVGKRALSGSHTVVDEGGESESGPLDEEADGSDEQQRAARSDEESSVLSGTEPVRAALAAPAVPAAFHAHHDTPGGRAVRDADNGATTHAKGKRGNKIRLQFAVF